MKSSDVRPHIAALFTAIGVSVGGLGLGHRHLYRVPSTLPTANSQPVGITSGSDRNLWFTEFNGNKIGRLTTS
jgi:hypothetical protein